MRNMLLDELNGGGEPVIIKARRSRRARRAANMLEQTYRRCQDLVAENQRECEALYQQQYQAGFRAGFQHLYQQWLIQLDEWAGLQKELAQARRVQLAEDLTALFTQPTIVDFIVKQLTQTTGTDVPSVVVLPAGITPPDSLLHIHCISGDDDNFAVQQGERVVRFPQDRLCRQWLTDIDTQEGIRELQRHIDTLPSARLDALCQSMTVFVQQLFTPKNEETS
ncbi:hypothetical protein SODG_007410 [Sodalis praecaptivus]|uniref:hypothetical protein n=1 Tax=Sodalis praecaptivus TaxID=1239307 RepID=UPI0027FC8291|nr:hypothetical protein [Sodalis praecaptivus]CAJ0998501.1 hypothetical protein NVIRENTERO_03358 [Sodalis praecaptivus]